jgi:hypothetical protein
MESRDGGLCEAVPEAGRWELNQPIGDLQERGSSKCRKLRGSKGCALGDYGMGKWS